MIYTWQRADWPNFRYDLSGLEPFLLGFSDKAGQVSGLLKGLSTDAQTEAVIDFMIAEAMKTSRIEGEYLSREDVSSSIRNQLGLNMPVEDIADPAAAGAAELMVAVRSTWQSPLDEDTLFAWHRMLMSGKTGLITGGWRKHEDPMQVVSGPPGHQKVHYEAPPSARVPEEMAAFLKWFNASEPGIIHAPVRSGLVHLYFESVHPFEDGNGRIGRALSEKALSQGLRRPVLLSLSQTIEANKKAYYDALECAQQSADVTPWLRYFAGMVLDAQTAAERQVDFILRKARFFDLHKAGLNGRQLRIVRRMLEEGPEGFSGGMNARKYVSMTRVSKATATRDMQELAAMGVFRPVGKGRSARYELGL